MKVLIRSLIVVVASTGFSLIALAGSDTVRDYSKESKEVAPVPPPPECDWTGFYIGVHAGGQFGWSETKDLDFYWSGDHQKWGYDESGFVGGAQVGYNFQWKWLVLGPEIDAGYMNLDGHGIEPWSNDPPDGPNTAKTDSDFYTTFRGRIGVSLDWHGCWLLYGTGGGIGVNYESRVSDPGEGVFGGKQDFNWGYTAGGGVERKIGTRWSVKVEYLYFRLDDQRFSAIWPDNNNTVYRFDTNSDGHIVRVGLNYHF